MSDLSPDDEALLEQARGGLEPSSSDHARIKGKLLVRIGVTALSATSAAAGAATTLTAGAGMTIATKVVVTAAVVLGALGGGAVLVQRSSAPAPSASSLALSRSAAVPSAAIPTPSSARLPSAPRAEPALSAVPPSPARFEAPAPSNPPVPAPLSPSLPRTTERAVSLDSRSSLDSPKPAAAEAVPVGPSNVGAEAQLLQQAGVALKNGHPAKALSILDEHAASFPHGMLAEEREAERIIVLCVLGRTEEAQMRASVFLEHSPRSPLAARVRGSCGGS
jgi:hypothetical protein